MTFKSTVFKTYWLDFIHQRLNKLFSTFQREKEQITLIFFLRQNLDSLLGTRPKIRIIFTYLRKFKFRIFQHCFLHASSRCFNRPRYSRGGVRINHHFVNLRPDLHRLKCQKRYKRLQISVFKRNILDYNTVEYPLKDQSTLYI